ncbi:1-deoxy-D-xylulose-5-phosphate synthase [Nocardia terpenica]
MSVLDEVHGPRDLKRMTHDQLVRLAAEIRTFLVDKVSRTGGHFGPNLGVVELTLALHRVFDSPRDPLLFDVGHQAYVHKIVTGRRAEFDTLRQAGGLSGYPARAESEHDFIENSHASVALSYADGLAKAFRLRGQNRHVVAVVGDGALTGGMCWEALNNIAAAPDRPVVIVVNDNGRSYDPTIGGVAEHLSQLRLRSSYEQALALGKRLLLDTPMVGPTAYVLLHAAKRGIKDLLAPQPLFEDLGLKYVGPVDGHDLRALETALRRAKAFGGPVIVHAVTHKGHGHAPAENDETDRMHQVGPPSGASSGVPWTSAFAEELVRAGRRRPDVIAIGAAMLCPTGLDRFAAEFPDRCFDVGIAEQHALTSAAGSAMGGMHPVVALYSTFLNRAFDQLLMDIALHRQPVTVVLDRSGITGPDGASHHGMWDLSLLGMIPGLRAAAPRDIDTLRAEFREALEVDDGPTVLRFPRGTAPAATPAVRRVGGVDVLYEPAAGARKDLLLVSVGGLADVALRTAHRLSEHDIGVTVVDPRWILPIPAEIPELAAEHGYVATVEDSGRHGGIGWAIAAALRDAGIDVPLLDLALPQQFQPHGTRSEVLAHAGLTADDIEQRITRWIGARDGRDRPSTIADDVVS